MVPNTRIWPKLRLNAKIKGISWEKWAKRKVAIGGKMKSPALAPTSTKEVCVLVIPPSMCSASQDSMLANWKLTKNPVVPVPTISVI